MKNKVIQTLLVGGMLLSMAYQASYSDVSAKEVGSIEVKSSDRSTDTNCLEAGVSRAIPENIFNWKFKEVDVDVTTGMLPEEEEVSVVARESVIVTESSPDTVVISQGLDSEPSVVKHEYVDMDVPSGNGFKAYESHTLSSGKLRFSNPPQVELQNQAYTDEATGIRMVDGRYCVALGSYYSVSIGQKFDLVMANGAIIPCILADGKDDGDTDSTNRACKVNGGITEFVIDRNHLNPLIKSAGSVSGMGGAFDGEIACIRMYL